MGGTGVGLCLGVIQGEVGLQRVIVANMTAKVEEAAHHRHSAAHIFLERCQITVMKMMPVIPGLARFSVLAGVFPEAFGHGS